VRRVRGPGGGLAWALPLTLCAAFATLTLGAPAPALATEGDTARQARAFERFEAGEDQFRLGHYDAAARLFREAWDLFPDPAYLFNVALAFERQERWPLAVEHYERFLAEYPDSPNRSDIERRLGAARESREAARAEVRVEATPHGLVARVVTEPGRSPCASPCVLRVDPGPTTVELRRGEVRRAVSRSLRPGEVWRVDEHLEAEPRPSPDRTGAIAAFATGGVALALGVVFGVMASATHADGKSLAAQGPLSGAEMARLDDLRGRLTRDSLVADVSFGVALAAGVVGAVLYFTASPPAPAAVEETPSSARLGWGAVGAEAP